MRKSASTIREVAVMAGVSPATVSRVLNGTAPVSPLTRERVLRAISALEFEPNAYARGLAKLESSTIATIISDIRNPFYGELIEGIQTVAEAHGYVNYLCHVRQSEEREIAYLSSLRARGVDGIIVGHSRLTDEQLWEHWEKMDVPVVLVNRAPPPLTTRAWSHVSTDDRLAGFLATTHLLQLGHERIAHLAGTRRSSVAQSRAGGYREALVAWGLAVDEGLILETDPPNPETASANMGLLLDRLSQPPTAVFAFSDLIAIGAMTAIRERGLRVPEDISVIGHDDIPAAKWVQPALTTIHMPVQEMGSLAMEMLLALLRTQEPLPGKIVDLKLIERASTAHPTLHSA